MFTIEISVFLPRNILVFSRYSSARTRERSVLVASDTQNLDDPGSLGHSLVSSSHAFKIIPTPFFIGNYKMSSRNVRTVIAGARTDIGLFSLPACAPGIILLPPQILARESNKCAKCPMSHFRH